MRYPEGTVCWIDLGTPDSATTAAFYTALFGWTVAEPDATGYRLCTLRGKLVAGLGPAEDTGPPYWTINLAVADIDATAASFKNLGAQIIVPPVTVGALGRSCVAIDPVGAPVSLWQPGAHTGMDLAGESGTFAGISLLTKEVGRAADFYRQALSWDTSAATIGPPPEAPTVQQSLWLTGFASDNPAADAARAQQLGATHVRSDSRGMVLRDPTGALFALWSAGDVASSRGWRPE